jgi:ABC-type transport system involved in multi-copper enzyme maturation permease subunit
MTTIQAEGGVRAFPPTAPVPLGRLVQVELRKLTDTRSGRWLLATIALITAAVIVIFLFTGPREELTFGNFVSATTTPQGVLLPILGILSVTSEWGQRTGLVTFTLEPRRSRVAVAKLVAVVLLGLAAVVVAIALAALANALGSLLRDGDGSWALGLGGLRDVVVQQLIGVVQGLAYGMLIMNSAGAIVTYFALPTAWSILVATVEWFRRIGEWVDLNTTIMPLVTHEMDGSAWARLAVSVLVWVGIPLALGWLRLLRRELKSA